jgi:hypothetical protein
MTTEGENLETVLRAFIEHQHESNLEILHRLANVEGDVSELNDDVTGLKSEIDGRFEGLANNIAQIKGGHAYLMATQKPELVAESLGYYYERMLSPSELIDMTRELPGVIPSTGDRESFLNADLVLKVKDKDERLTNYLAVEISYTGQQRDADRAKRNAGFLQQFTGRPARAAVASVEMDDATQSEVDDGTILWYRITAADLQPD